jgi:hypothetical protein
VLHGCNPATAVVVWENGRALDPGRPLLDISWRTQELPRGAPRETIQDDHGLGGQ